LTTEYEASTFRDPEDLPAGRSTGTSRSILSNRVSHFLDINGPSITVDTACSATMTAVDIACQYLALGKADSMVVAGSTLYMDPITLQDPGPMKEAFSTSGKCHSFDAKADGYIRAEAINAVFLKRLDEALRDRDPIRAIIRGTAVNSDGHTPGLTSPNPAAQAAAIRAAYRNAGITSFDDTGFLECHGTGTYSGDPLEIEGLASVFAPTRPAHKPLIIGSIKSNIGHSEAAAGLSGLIKAAMVVEKGIIPGNPTFITPNPRIDFEGSRVRVSRDATPWPEYAPIRRASVNSFGFGGSNGHCVLEAVDTHLETHGSSKTFVSSFGEGNISSWIDGDYDDDETPGALGSRPLQLLTFSANDRDALTANVKAISNHLIHPAVTVSLADVAYTLSERRTHHFHRAFIVTDSTDFVTGTETVAKKRAEPPRVGFVFTGQGAQWSAMGKHLLSHFPLAKAIVAELDAALQTLPQPPSWSLLDKLTQKQDPVHLRRPEISQPLVTALQLALLRVLEHWGIRPESVVGHSSGEIAAAVAAGLIPADAAIKVAYLRGQAAVSRPPQQDLGMLAVGLSVEQVVAYLGTEPTVHIACFNSPSSLTLCGPLADLERVRDRVQKDGHFARLLQVDLAYHSEYMADIAAEYERLLVESCAVADEAGDTAVATDVSMISSVTGRVMEPGVRPDPAYWRRNMTSPVRFAQAATEMLSRPHGPEFLIEIGPSNALSGPVAQVIAAMGSTSQVQYTSAAKRGPDTLLSLFDAVGKLWANGGSVDMTRVNTYDQPSLVVDLPNYQWNHSNRYWHQGLASEEWRHRKFVSHDLLGSKIPGTSWKAPSWLRMIRLDDLPWLRDHEIASQLLFPGTGFLAMAMEAAFQTTAVNEWSAYGSTQPASFTYHMENVQFLRGLELSETNAVRVMLTLTPVYAPLKPWHEFNITSVSNDGTSSILHCTGLVRIVSEPAFSRLPTAPPPGVMEPLKYPHNSDYCYRLMHGTGYHYGPHFQRLVEIEWTWGGARTLGTLSLAEPPSTYRQSRYPIHPVSLDSFLQFSGFSVRQRQKKFSGVESLVPGRIDNLVVAGGADACHASVARVALSAALGGQGKKERATSYEVAGAAYDPDDGRCLLEMKGLRFTTLGADADVATSHSYARLAWNVDLSLTDEASLNRVLSGHTAGSGSWCKKVLELVRHTNPAASVLEVATNPESASCLSLDGRDVDTAHFAAFHFVSNGPKQLLEIQDRHSTVPNATFQLLDATVPGTVISTDQCDFAVLRVGPRSTARGMSTVIDNISRSLTENGQLLLVHEADPPADVELEDAVALLRERFVSVKNLSKATCCLAALAQSPIPNLADKRQNGDQVQVNPTITCLRFTQPNARSLAILNNLRNAGFIIHDHDANCLSEEHIPASSTVLCLDELFETVTATLTPACWSTLQSLIRTECHLLWVTSGAQGPGPRATHPDRAASHGLLRVLRAEEPHLRLLTLDVAEHSSEEASFAAVHTLLIALLQHSNSTQPAFAAENEFCAGLDGAIYTPRVVPDENINTAKFEHVRGGRKAEPVDFATTERYIRLRAERPGMIDSLEYVEVHAAANLELVCEEEVVEVEMYAVGVNFKDVMLTLGLVGGAGEFSIGSEGAGVVTRVGLGVTSVRLGQRVVVIWQGMYANRVRVPARCVHRIPDGLSFADAATLPVAYLTALLGLRDLGGLKKGQRVLIHSATGGVGNAAVQLAKYIGAEVSASNDSHYPFREANY
jgi:acyl transferase domain-containing protein